MRRVILTLANLLIITLLFAQAPEKMNFQAVVRNAAGELVVNKQIGIFVAIQKKVEGATLPTTVYQEKHTTTSNANGLITLQIGAGTTSFPYHALSFSQIKWEEGPLYIKTLIDPAGGTNYTITTESQLLSVPYALYAKTAGNAGGQTATCPDGTTKGELKYWDGSQWLTIAPSMNGSVLKIENGTVFWADPAPVVQMPIVTTSAATVRYTSVTCGGYVQAEGGGTVVERGICYGTSPDPTVANNVIKSGSGMGSFSATLINLVEKQTYYARAYATNSAGTMYGENITFAITGYPKYGELYQGGLVAYIYRQGEEGYVAGEFHGFVVTDHDLTQEIADMPATFDYLDKKETSPIIGSGKSNTQAIILHYGTGNYAAKLCDDLSLNGYNDWYLPSIDEWIQIGQNITPLPNLTHQINYYITSSSTNITIIRYYKYCLTEKRAWSGDNGSYKVRAIRSF